MKYRNIITYLTFLILLFGCENNFIAETAAYIQIDNFIYQKKNELVDSNNYNLANITDAWISMDGQVIGNFEIPFTAPVLEEGTHSFDIYPGIKANGISGTRIKYPFYEKFETEITLEKNKIIQIYPETKYKEETLFYFEEQGQFEIGGTMFEKSSISDTTAIIQSETVFQGEKSAAIYLDSINDYFDIRNIQALTLNINTFLELHFKSNINFNIGIIILSPGNIEEKRELIQIYQTESWKKIYLDLSPLISMGTNLSTFKIYIDGNYDNSKTQNNIYIDNLKLVYN